MPNKPGDITLNGYDYRVNLSSYRRKDVNDFSPRATTPGGQIFSDLNLYQQIEQNDWRHGFGFSRLTDANGYSHTEGLVDTRHAGVAMLYTSPQISLTPGINFEDISGFISAEEYIIAWGSSGVYVTNSSKLSAWTRVSSYNVQTAWWSGQYLFIFPALSQPRYASAPFTSWTETGVNANSTDYIWTAVHDGYVFAGKEKTITGENGNEVYYASEDDLSDLHGDPDDDTNAIFIGTNGGETVNAVSFANQLVVFRTDSIYTVNAGRDGSSRILDFKDVDNSVNFESVAIHNGTLVFPILNKVYQWNGTRLSEITPKQLNDSFPYISYGDFRNFLVIGDYLYCIARTNDTTYKESILAFDGVSWFRMCDLVTEGGDYDTVSALGYSPYHNMFLIAKENSGDSYTSLYYIPFNEYSDFPYPLFPIGSDADALYTSSIDCGYTRVKKSTPSLAVECQCTENSYLLVYYSIDGGSYTAWGGTDGVTNKLTNDGVTILNNPTGSATRYSTIEYNKISLKFRFYTTTDLVSPILKAYSLRVLLRPDTYYGWSFSVIVERDVASRTSHRDTRETTTEILEDLRDARDSYAPVRFTDISGTNFMVYITSIVDNPLEYELQQRGGKPNFHTDVTLSLVEVARDKQDDGTRYVISDSELGSWMV